jgi:hypothetical protein
MSFGAAYLPWLILVMLLLMSQSRRAAVPWTAAAGVYTAFIIFSYLRDIADPRQWVVWSGPRLMLTPLLLLFFGVMASHAERASLRLKERAFKL